MRFQILYALLSGLLSAGLDVAPAVSPGLDHVRLSLDHETFAAIEQSDYLKSRFAVFEERTTVRTDKTYSGIYLYGRETYIEFGDDTGTGIPAGAGLIAFGGDEPPAGVPAVAGDSGTAPRLATRELDGAQIPWYFTMAQPWKSGPDMIFGTSLMENDPNFLARWHPEANSPKTNGATATRAAVLDRYKAVLKGVPSQPLMADVTGLTMAVKPESKTRLEAWMKTIGTNFPIHFVDAPGEGIARWRCFWTGFPSAKRRFDSARVHPFRCAATRLPYGGLSRLVARPTAVQ
jgi:uncharacterized protein DUF5829